MICVEIKLEVMLVLMKTKEIRLLYGCLVGYL
jgi:hypothetical protein